jgi:hypothetical protein
MSFPGRTLRYRWGTGLSLLVCPSLTCDPASKAQGRGLPAGSGALEVDVSVRDRSHEGRRVDLWIASLPWQVGRSYEKALARTRKIRRLYWTCWALTVGALPQVLDGRQGG